MKSTNLCFNCLGFGHKTRECRSSSRCKMCAKLHHTTLHRETAPSPTTTEAISAADTATVNTVTPEASSPQTNLMMTSQVVLEAPSGKKLIARTLLDSGASVSLVSNRAVQCLQLQNPRQLTLSGVQEAITGSSNHAVNIILSPTHPSKAKVHLTASVVTRVTCDLPLQGAGGSLTFRI